MTSKKYRIKSKFRFTFFLVIVLTIICGLGVYLTDYKVDAVTKDNYNYIEVVAGDTLWDIAKTYMPENQDIRKSVYIICDLNDISADELNVGQLIMVPKGI